MFRNPLENDLAAEGAFLTLQSGSVVAKTIVSAAVPRVNFLQITSHDYQVLREDLPLEGKKLSGRFKNSSVILLIIVSDQPLKSPVQKTR